MNETGEQYDDHDEDICAWCCESWVKEGATARMLNRSLNSCQYGKESTAASFWRQGWWAENTRIDLEKKHK